MENMQCVEINYNTRTITHYYNILYNIYKNIDVLPPYIICDNNKLWYHHLTLIHHFILNMLGFEKYKDQYPDINFRLLKKFHICMKLMMKKILISDKKKLLIHKLYKKKYIPSRDISHLYRQYNLLLVYNTDAKRFLKGLNSLLD